MYVDLQSCSGPMCSSYTSESFSFIEISLETLDLLLLQTSICIRFAPTSEVDLLYTWICLRAGNPVHNEKKEFVQLFCT